MASENILTNQKNFLIINMPIDAAKKRLKLSTQVAATDRQSRRQYCILLAKRYSTTECKRAVENNTVKAAV
jgi:hypothetical protein